jgi:hypothetical protein
MLSHTVLFRVEIYWIRHWWVFKNHTKPLSSVWHFAISKDGPHSIASRSPSHWRNGSINSSLAGSLIDAAARHFSTNTFRWEFSCVTCKSSHGCKGSHNYKIFTLSSLIPSFSEELELQKPSSEEYQIQGLLTWPWVVSQLKLKKFYRNMSSYCLKVPEVNISVMKFTFFVLVSTHELCNLMMFLCFSVFNKWTSD